MTIVFFARLFYPHIGGVEKHILEISKRLIKKGFDVIVFTENFASTDKNVGFYPAFEEYNGIKIYRINPGKSERLKKFKIWLSLLKHISVLKSANIVHCHDIFFWFLPFKLLFPFKKVYTTFHGYEANQIPNIKSVLMHKMAEKLSLGNICVGSFYNKWYKTNPTLTVYGASNVSKIKNKETENNLIIFIGRLEEETGIMEYLEAFKNISMKFSKFRLLILGDGSKLIKAENFVKKYGLSVEFKGFINDVDKYIKRASFVFVSRYLGIIESLMSKKYVFAVYNNKIKEDYLKMTPFAKNISICASSKEIEKEFMYLLKNANVKQQRIEKSYRWAKNQTWENMVGTYLKLWNINS